MAGLFKVFFSLESFRHRIENRVPGIRENYQGKYLDGYCNQYYEMVIMDALLCIIQKTHCMRLLLRGVNNMRFLF